MEVKLAWQIFFYISMMAWSECWIATSLNKGRHGMMPIFRSWNSEECWENCKKKVRDFEIKWYIVYCCRNEETTNICAVPVCQKVMLNLAITSGCFVTIYLAESECMWNVHIIVTIMYCIQIEHSWQWSYNDLFRLFNKGRLSVLLPLEATICTHLWITTQLSVSTIHN